MGAPESLGEFWDFEKFLIILGNSSVILGSKMFIWRFFVIYPYFLIILEIFRYLSIFFSILKIFRYLSVFFYYFGNLLFFLGNVSSLR